MPESPVRLGSLDSPASPPPVGRRHTWRWLLAYGGLILVFGLLIEIPLVFLLDRFGLATPGGGNTPRVDDPVFLARMLGQLAAILLATRATCRLSGVSWPEAGFQPTWRMRDAALGGIIGIASFALIPVAAHALGWAAIHPSGGDAPDILRSFGVSSGVFLVAAASEEIGLRGLPIALFGARTLLAVVVTALIFVAFHLVNPGANAIAAIEVLVAGITLAVARLRTRALWLPIGWHAGWNLAQGWIFGTRVSGAIPATAPLFPTVLTGPAAWTGGPFGPESGFLSVAVNLVALGVFVAVVPDRRRGSGES
jgi:membrane protease YdiL (CAAX protease family)